jgi:hypothetical protein
MPSPLFLLAPPRSYTSLFNAMIGQHPQAYGMPELNLFNVTHLKNLWHRVSDDIGGDTNRRHGLLRTVAEVYGGEQTAATVNMAIHWCAARQEMESGEIYKELVAKLDPRIIVEKSPAYTIATDRLNRMFDTFPDSRFIHLVRHPIPQCESVLKLNNGVFAVFVNSFDFSDDRCVLDPQIAWHDININILNLLARVPKDQQMRLRGEDCMAAPEEHLRGICRWLEIRDDDDAIAQMMKPEKSAYACFGPINALFGNDPNFMRGPAFRPHKPKVPPLNGPLSWRDDGKRLRPEVVALAQEFGYV